MHKVILADHQDVFRVGLARLLANEDGLRVVAQASELAKVDSAIAAHPESMVIVSASIIDDLTEFASRARKSLCRILAIASERESIEVYRSAGVAGVITRNTPPVEFIDCVRQILHGVEFASTASARATEPDTVGIRAANRLIASEKRVVALLMEGLKNKGIAERLSIQEQVVKNHLQHIFDKTGCSTRVELALYVAHHPGFAVAIAQG
jgi:DNA-binding NarL/FixJ family response regulator